MEMLRNFLFEIAGCTSNFTVQNRQQTCVNEIREKVDKSKVLVSGAAAVPANACLISIQTGPRLWGAGVAAAPREASDCCGTSLKRSGLFVVRVRRVVASPESLIRAVQRTNEGDCCCLDASGCVSRRFGTTRDGRTNTEV